MNIEYSFWSVLMKKVLVLFGAVALLPMASMAYINESESSSIKSLSAQGYSTSTLEVVDWANARNQGEHSKYVRFFRPKNNGKIGRAYQRLKVYIDPVQDDGQFADHQLEYSNTWTGREVKYSSDLEPTGSIERL